jgi:uncharacterized repeat protein (TIGR03803 family)
MSRPSILLAVTMFWGTAQGQTFSVVSNFLDAQGQPGGALIQGLDGQLYGMGAGGENYNDGVIYKITTAGVLTPLYAFSGTDGMIPGPDPGALALAADGTFYGTTQQGGPADNCGTVFAISSEGQLTTLHNFSCSDGDFPNEGLVQGTDGNFYGTTAGGGTNGQGTVFMISTAGNFTSLYSFSGQDGASPEAGLVLAANGDFYGVTAKGGLNGDGTIFQITPSGVLTTLHNFDRTDGYMPEAPLIVGSNGQLFGTTRQGGTGFGGTFFEVSLSGTITTIHNFIWASADGYYPNSPVIQATNGDFYGPNDGNANLGLLFQIGAGGAFTPIVPPQSIYTYELGPLFQATDGMIYGGAPEGGSAGYGVIYSISLGLPPFVRPQPAFGTVGAQVSILGSSLTGASRVAFNGTPAAFQVISPTAISAVVPAGATTGKITVTSPQGRLVSNTAFSVLE